MLDFINLYVIICNVINAKKTQVMGTFFNVCDTLLSRKFEVLCMRA